MKGLNRLILETPLRWSSSGDWLIRDDSPPEDEGPTHIERETEGRRLQQLAELVVTLYPLTQDQRFMNSVREYDEAQRAQKT